MTIQDWNPFLRFARQRDNTLLQGLLQATDHRILYFHSGSGFIEAEGQNYPIEAGILIYIPAGTAYRFLFKKEPPVLTLTFSRISGNRIHLFLHFFTTIFPGIKFLSPSIWTREIFPSNASAWRKHFHLKTIFFKLSRSSRITVYTMMPVAVRF